jgi:Flp pilus assembly protein TadD
LRPELRLLGQVEVHVAAGRAAEALALIERVSMPVAEWPEMHALRGEALAQLGRTEEAIEAYRLALDRVPEDTQEPPVLYLRRLQELEESAAR